MGSAHVTDLFPLLLSALLSLLWLSLKVDAIALMRNKGDAAPPFWRKAPSMSAWGLHILSGLTNSTQRPLSNAKCDTLASITSKLPTAVLEWYKAEQKTRDLETLSSPNISFYQNCPSCFVAPPAAVFCQVGSKTLSGHSCLTLAKLVSSQRGFVAMEELSKACQIFSILLGYFASSCKM